MITYEELDVLLAEYHIDLYRHDAYVRSIVNKRLDAMQKELMAKIALHELDGITKKEADELFKDINKIITENYSAIGAYLNSGFGQVFAVSVAASAYVYNDWLKADVFVTLPKYKMEAIKQAVIFEGAPFADWWEKQEQAYQFKIQRIVRQGMIDKTLESTMTSELSKALDISKSQARTLISTATSSIAAAAQDKLFEVNADVIQGKQHISTLDNRTTAACRARDLLMWTLDNEPIGHEMKFRPIPLHFRCRSIMRAVLDVNATLIKQKLGKRASQFGPVNAGLNYEEYLKGQSQPYQEDVLGKKRAKWLRDGKINLKQMLDAEDRFLTLKELMKKYGVE